MELGRRVGKDDHGRGAVVHVDFASGKGRLTQLERPVEHLKVYRPVD